MNRRFFLGIGGFWGFLGALMLWFIVAAPLSVASAALTTWPTGLAIPWIGSTFSALGVLIAVAIYVLVCQVRRPDDADAGLDRRVVIQWAIGVALALAFVVVQVLVWNWVEGERVGAMSLGRGVIASILLGVATFGAAVYMWNCSWIRQHRSVVFNWKTSKHIVNGAVLAIVVACVPLLVFYRLYNGGFKGIGAYIVNNPGGLFTFLTGLFTLVGVYIALQSLSISGQQVTTFSDMVQRLCDLIESTPEEDFVRYMCYTPLTGSLAIPERQFNHLHDLMQGISKRVAVVTLVDDDLGKWLRAFEGKATEYGAVEGRKVEKAIEDAKNLLTTLEARRSGERHFCPRRLAFVDMPGFYTFSNSQRAIVVAPLSLPPLQSSKGNYIRKMGPVQMVGIETGDPEVVARVNALHSYYYSEFRSETSPGLPSTPACIINEEPGVLAGDTQPATS